MHSLSSRRADEHPDNRFQAAPRSGRMAQATTSARRQRRQHGSDAHASRQACVGLRDRISKPTPRAVTGAVSAQGRSTESPRTTVDGRSRTPLVLSREGSHVVGARVRDSFRRSKQASRWARARVLHLVRCMHLVSGRRRSCFWLDASREHPGCDPSVRYRGVDGTQSQPRAGVAAVRRDGQSCAPRRSGAGHQRSRCPRGRRY